MIYPTYAELRELAVQEIKNPVGAYDKVCANDEHPLNWLLTKEEPTTMPSPRKFPSPGRRFASDDNEELTAEAALDQIKALFMQLNPDEQDRLTSMMARETGATDGLFSSTASVVRGVNNALQRNAQDGRRRASAMDSAAARKAGDFDDRYPDARFTTTNVFGRLSR